MYGNLHICSWSWNVCEYDMIIRTTKFGAIGKLSGMQHQSQTNFSENTSFSLNHASLVIIMQYNNEIQVLQIAFGTYFSDIFTSAGLCLPVFVYLFWQSIYLIGFFIQAFFYVHFKDSELYDCMPIASFQEISTSFVLFFIDFNQWQCFVLLFIDLNQCQTYSCFEGDLKCEGYGFLHPET